MSVIQLRNHIPIAGPARREPTDGTETAMRVSLGFEPAWYHRRCGIDFSERWHTDPFYRHDTLVIMKNELHRSFPQVKYWNPNHNQDTWTLSGCFGAYVIPQLFGCKLQYAPDRWPVIIERPTMTIKEWASLSLNELINHPFVESLNQQMDIIESTGNAIHGYLTWHSVINNAFNIRGQEIFTDMVDDPEITHQFLTLICDVIIQLAHQVQERQRRSGFPIDQLDISNCVMNMISPRTYRSFIYPYDRRIAESFEKFGVHTCNWDVTPFIHDLARLPKVGYLDMGSMSDLKLVKQIFPEARRAVMYSPVKLQDASIGEIQADMQKIYGEISPCDIVMADIQAETPDKRVLDLLDICHTLELSGSKLPFSSSG